MVMVSHIDDDHINGVLQMLRQLSSLQNRRRPLPYEVTTLWHNSFDDLIGNEADELAAALRGAVRPVSRGGNVPANIPLSRESALVLASVKQGRDLRNSAESLGLNVNEGFGGRLIMVPNGRRSQRHSLGNGLTFTVIGPSQERVEDLQEEWNRQIRRLGVARAASFTDKSVFNLSSLIVVAKDRRRTMLLTGDARGDDILQALKTARMMRNGVSHFDLLKIPHHGSDRNVSTDFFRQVTADHYVVSGDGSHHNPEKEMFRMLFEARPRDSYKLYLTNREQRLASLFQREKPRGCELIIRSGNARSVSVDLGDQPEF
jgi:hypothetical protein